MYAVQTIISPELFRISHIFFSSFPVTAFAEQGNPQASTALSAITLHEKGDLFIAISSYALVQTAVDPVNNFEITRDGLASL